LSLLSNGFRARWSALLGLAGFVQTPASSKKFSLNLMGCRREDRCPCDSTAQGLKRKELLKQRGRGQREYEVATRKH